MRVLYHYGLCPFSRKIRLVLAEKKLDFVIEPEKIWDRRAEFLSLDPAGKVPVLVDLNGSVVADSHAITEYLEEAYPETPLLGKTLTQRAEVRRLIAWFDDQFSQEVSMSLLLERILKRLLYQDSSAPNSALIRMAKKFVHHHLEYISYLVDRRKWLAGDELSVADLAGAAHLSVVDYLGDVPWEDHPFAKDWYARLKSRPSFRPILADRIPGVRPAAHYEDLDF